MAKSKSACSVAMKAMRHGKTSAARKAAAKKVKSVETGDGRLEQSSCLPVVEGDIERPGVTHGGNATDDGIRLKIEKHQSRTNLAFSARRERELTNEDLPEHQRQES